MLLAPGDRAQVMIAGSQSPGDYRLLALPDAQSGMGQSGMGQSGTGTPGSRTGPVGATVLATLKYSGREDFPAPLPGHLIPVPVLSASARSRTFVLGQGMGRGMGMGAAGMSFTINGLTFDPARVDSLLKNVLLLFISDSWVEDRRLMIRLVKRRNYAHDSCVRIGNTVKNRGGLDSEDGESRRIERADGIYYCCPRN